MPAPTHTTTASLRIHRPRHGHQPWPSGLQRCVHSALPWLSTDCCPLTAANVLDNLAAQRPNVWVCTQGNTTLAASSISDIVANQTAVLHGISHQQTTVEKPTKQAAIAAVSLAALEAAFTEHRAQTVLAHVPHSHAGARGFCWNTGFTRNTTPAQPQQPIIIGGRSIPVYTYTLSAQRYFSTTRQHLLAQCQHAIT